MAEPTRLTELQAKVEAVAEEVRNFPARLLADLDRILREHRRV